jgi:hypothetical protein
MTAASEIRSDQDLRTPRRATGTLEIQLAITDFAAESAALSDIAAATSTPLTIPRSVLSAVPEEVHSRRP